MLNKKFFKIHNDSGIISEFASVNPNNIDDNGVVIGPESNDHFTWIAYDEQFEEYVDQQVTKGRWNIIINDTNFGDLENMTLGAIYRSSVPRLLPKIDFGTTNPNWFVFDFELNEWKSPLFEASGIKIWNTETQSYIDLPTQ